MELYHTIPVFKKNCVWGKVFPHVKVSDISEESLWSFPLLEIFLSSFSDEFIGTATKMRPGRKLCLRISKDGMLLYKVEITDNAKDVYASINLQRESLVMISARDRVPTSFLQFIKQVNRRYNNPLQQLYERSISPASVARKKRGLMKCELAQTLASFNGFKYMVLQGTNPFKNSKQMAVITIHMMIMMDTYGASCCYSHTPSLF